MFKNFVTGVLLTGSITVLAQQQKDSISVQQRIQEIVVSGIKAGTTMPVTQSTLNAKQIGERYYGADLPSVFKTTPSINAYSDNGTGIGYSFFRLRGIDQSRINLTINGMPVNDAESQGTFFNNFADLASSAESIQIQRGVGTSTNGTASFGGSVNIQTKLMSEKPEVHIQTGVGSFGSRRLTAEYQSGMLESKTAFYFRVSDIATNGYRDHSGAQIQSAFLSGAWFGKRSVIKANIMTGSTESELAYTGIDQQTLDTARTTNYFTHQERDAFIQTFYQLQYSFQFSDYSGFSASAYYVNGNAPRFQYFLDGSYNSYAYMNMPDAIVIKDTLTYTDAIGSYRLKQDFAGFFANYFYKKGRIDFNAGLHANSFTSRHFMEVNWARVLPQQIEPDHQAYFNTGYKKEVSAFAKLSYNLTEKLYLFGDLQIRGAGFTYEGQDKPIHRDTFQVEPMNWLFINPRGGLKYMINQALSTYAMLGMTTREPTRFDYFLDEFPHRDISQDDILPESVLDIEAGLQYNNAKWNIQANVFQMSFQNMLSNTGQLNNVGIPVTSNVGSGFRQGLEIDLVWKAHPIFWITHNSCWMKGNISKFTQFYDSAGAYTTSVGITYSNTTPALTPPVIINQGVRIIPTTWIYMDIMGHYVAQQYLDNTQDEQLSIEAFSYFNAKIGLSLKRWLKHGEPTLAVQVNNFTNSLYSPSGHTSGNVINYDAAGMASKQVSGMYFPSATRNFFITVGWRF